MTRRAPLYVLMLVVAAAAAVLSFDGLHGLALVCGFSPRLAWLLPVVVDAGAAAGSLVWLSGRVGDTARRFARALALSLLALSVAANALGHGLDAYGVRPHWLVVVAVSAVAPAVLGAVVHLAVLVGRPVAGPAVVVLDELLVDDGGDGVPANLDEHGLSRLWESAPPASAPVGHDPGGRAAELIAAGAGRRRLSRELAISEHEARALLAASRNGAGR